MKNRRLTRRVAATVGITAAILAGALTACGGGETPAPSSTTTTTTTAPPPATVSPTEKSINPTGGNLFTPPVKAPAAPTAIPGDN
jgi:hypothetical protein